MHKASRDSQTNAADEKKQDRGELCHIVFIQQGDPVQNDRPDSSSSEPHSFQWVGTTKEGVRRMICIGQSKAVRVSRDNPQANQS